MSVPSYGQKQFDNAVDFVSRKNPLVTVRSVERKLRTLIEENTQNPETLYVISGDFCLTFTREEGEDVTVDIFVRP